MIRALEVISTALAFPIILALGALAWIATP
jgi:hypothetical protein